MDEVPSLVGHSNNLSSKGWFLGKDEAVSIPLDGSEGGLFAGNFVPPPPRPLFLDEGITPDGLTTCDLCSWAWQNGNAYAVDTGLEATGELGWVLTLVIVSLISALIGAIVMIIVLHCKRLKNAAPTAAGNRHPPCRGPPRPPISTPDDKSAAAALPPPGLPGPPNNLSGVWSWLSRRSAASPSQLENSPSSLVENHYTHMEDAYNGGGGGNGGDALYAELEVESAADRHSPAYQNSAYTDPDAPTSSAPSSAYYSDLSITTVPDRAYEVVGLATMPVWEPPEQQGRKQPPRLAAISENVTVPSDYV